MTRLGTGKRVAFLATLALTLVFLVTSPRVAGAGGRVAVHGLRMVPQNSDAREVSEANWGAGLMGAFPLKSLGRLMAGTVGIEGVEFNTARSSGRNRFGEPYTQVITQEFYRLSAGLEVGPHGRGFLRPHAGVGASLAHYRIDNDLTYSGGFGSEYETVELSDESHTRLGYDLSLGVDLNVMNRFGVDGGVRYVKSFDVPQDLGEDSEKIHPDYIQIYAGVMVSFELFEEIGDARRESTPHDDEGLALRKFGALP
jgi:opacity protein-like surface antigen